MTVNKVLMKPACKVLNPLLFLSAFANFRLSFFTPAEMLPSVSSSLNWICVIETLLMMIIIMWFFFRIEVKYTASLFPIISLHKTQVAVMTHSNHFKRSLWRFAEPRGISRCWLEKRANFIYTVMCVKQFYLI